MLDVSCSMCFYFGLLLCFQIIACIISVMLIIESFTLPFRYCHLKDDQTTYKILIPMVT